MALNAEQQNTIHDFRAWIERGLNADPRFAAPTREDRPDHSTLATRWPSAANPRLWFEVALRPFLPQLRVGILTDDRWKSEDLEEKIQESGDSMSEFVGLGFEENGLDWPEPPVEHYREQLKYFYFATPLDLRSIDEIANDAIRRKTRQMIDGYFMAFEKFLA